MEGYYLRLPQETKEQLRKEAERRQITVSAIIRERIQANTPEILEKVIETIELQNQIFTENSKRNEKIYEKIFEVIFEKLGRLEEMIKEKNQGI